MLLLVSYTSLSAQHMLVENTAGTNQSAIHGSSINGPGIYGLTTSPDFAGLWGLGDNSLGVLGTSATGKGVVAAGGTYDFDAIGNGIDYGSTSSRRWKRNIVCISDPLGKINGLRGVYFDWDDQHGGGHDIGFIAEEVGEILPEIVVYEANGVDASGLDYSRLTPLLVEAIKALQLDAAEKIRQLSDRIAKLREELEKLKSGVGIAPTP